MELWELLGVKPGVTAIIGSGGKTTMLHTLAAELSRRGRVLCCTTTHIRIPGHLPVLLGPTEEALEQASSLPCLCAGSGAGEGKLGPLSTPLADLARRWDYVLVEADGARGLPLKAHAPHEPVVPPCAGLTVLVAGCGGLGRPIREAVHRPELFCRLTGRSPGDIASPEAAAEALRAEGLGDLVFLNQADSPRRRSAGLALAKNLDRPVFLGALQKGVWEACVL